MPCCVRRGRNRTTSGSAVAIVGVLLAVPAVTRADTDQLTLRFVTAAGEEPGAVCIADAHRGAVRAFSAGSGQGTSVFTPRDAQTVVRDGMFHGDSRLPGGTELVLRGLGNDFEAYVDVKSLLTCTSLSSGRGDLSRVVFVSLAFGASGNDSPPLVRMDMGRGTVYLTFRAAYPTVELRLSGGSYWATAGSIIVNPGSGTAYAELPIYLRRAKRRVALPPGWPESGTVAARLFVDGRERSEPIERVDGAPSGFLDLIVPAADGKKEILLDLLDETEGPRLARAALRYDTPLPEPGAPAALTATSFEWLADPLFSGKVCPRAELPDAGASCVAGAPIPGARVSCRYLCDAVERGAFTLPTRVRLRHPSGDGMWEETLRSARRPPVEGYVPLADRVLRLPFAPGWDPETHRVELVFEDGRSEIAPAVRACSSRRSRGCTSIVPVPGLRSGAQLTVRTSGPRSYDDLVLSVC